MKVCILSGRYPGTQFESTINHKLYADKYSYSYIHCNYPTKAKNPYLNKIHYILSYIDLFDYIVWIDDDAFFLDFENDIMQYLPDENVFMSICRSPTFKKIKTFFSSGQFILRCNKKSKRFLEDALEVNLVEVKSWWTKDLGYFSNGDQDIFIYLFLTQEIYMKKYKLFDYKAFNSRYENLFEKDIHKPLIIHFTGVPKIKKYNYIKTQQKLNLHASLVPLGWLENYKLHMRNSNFRLKKWRLKKLIKWFYR
ncbi:putative nucleotide-diphospho-sugar transferase [Seonamhaeicola maritimus]|uniref:Uncharacterized protein n=1 Tax=Seonamhaeicola maritimus TaxID=2591822 RepID=A0A5C7GKX0_9FLAO|nr:putative nucleotide-diphospho-sugar transferase [Seonamhaeicola maritimus]TXG38865.1 hypothetical protein FUA22_02960 [Seonamhaeicola maritimus]